MRPTTRCLTAAVALAFAHAAFAATIASTPGGTPTLHRNTPVTSALTVPGTPSATQPATITINQPAPVEPRKVENVTTVDVRSQQTQAATAGTHSSGSTSSLGPLATGTGSSTGNTNATGSTTENGTVTALPFTGAVGTPFLVNPSDATSGALASTSNGQAMTNNGVAGSSDFSSAPLVASNGIVVTEDQLNARVNASNVDRAIAQVQRDRKRAGRNGQLLYSIAPRTNVDRSNEAPNDGPSPALSGYNSALAR